MQRILARVPSNRLRYGVRGTAEHPVRSLDDEEDDVGTDLDIDDVSVRALQKV
jgi:hypothetical protein